MCKDCERGVELYPCGVCGECLNERVREWAEIVWEKYVEILSLVTVEEDGTWKWPDGLSREAMWTIL